LLHALVSSGRRKLVLSFSASCALLALSPLLGGCDGHNADAGQRVTSDTVVATFDPTDVVYRTVTLSPGPHGMAGSGLWHFDVFDVDNKRLDGLKTHWLSSNPAVVTPLFSDVTTKASDVMWETTLDLRAFAAGDAMVTGTVVGAKTKGDLPVTVTLNVHATGPGISITTLPPVQAGVLNLDPHVRALGEDLIDVAAVPYDAAGERVVGAKLNWTCLGAATDAEFARADGPEKWVGAGCSTYTNDTIGHDVPIRAYHTGAYTFRVSLDGAPEVSALATIVYVDGSAHLELDPPAVAVVVGGQRRITGVIVDADGSRYPAMSLMLEPHNVAVADRLGDVVTGVASGTVPGQAASTTFTASVGPLTAELGVIVYRPPAMVVVSPALTLAPATQGKVSAALVDTDGITLIPASATTLTWSTLDPSVATAVGVADMATVSAVTAGMTEVRVATAEGVMGAAAVTVGTPGGMGGAGGMGGGAGGGAGGMGGAVGGGVGGMGGAGGAGGSAPAGCYPECIEALRRSCVPAGACTMNATPTTPFPDTFYYCYADGVRIVAMSTSTGSRHTQYRTDGSVCFTIDTTFSGTAGRNVSEVWKDGAGNLVGTETYDSMAADLGRSHAVTCGGQTVAVDSMGDGCVYPECTAQNASCM